MACARMAGVRAQVLRLMLAPLWEAVVLLDRLLYLREHGYAESALVPLFDPTLSPRSYGLVVLKRPPPARVEPDACCAECLQDWEDTI